MDRPTLSEICEIARRATTIFASKGLSCCLTGGTACALYGTTRCPNDLDLVVLTDAYPQETLKRILVEADARFYLVASKDPLATYKVLWFRLSPAYTRYARRCKVDILRPGVMSIPDVPARRVERISGLPVMPFALLLMLKLQSWTDHRDSLKHYMRPKQHDDVRDIEQLLDIARRRAEKMAGDAVAWIPAAFVDAAKDRMRQHVARFPAEAPKWRAIGYSAGSNSSLYRSIHRCT